MAIYIGRDGVTREAAGVEGGAGVWQHAMDCMINVDGTARHCMDWTSELDHVEIEARGLGLWKLKSDFTITNHVRNLTLSELSDYGSVSVTATGIQLTASKAEYFLELVGIVLFVFRDGHKVWGTHAQQAIANIVFAVGYSIGFRGNGTYTNLFCEVAVKEGYVSNSASGTTTLDMGIGPFPSAITIAAGTVGSYAYCGQTYQSCTIGGKSFPIKVVNNLK